MNLEGKDKVNTNDWDYYYNKYNLKFDTLGTNFITTDWTLNSLWGSTNDRPNTVQLRFKAETPTPYKLIPIIMVFRMMVVTLL
jgi:hypothetical protein